MPTHAHTLNLFHFCLFSWFEKRVNMLTGKKELPSMILLGLASGVGAATLYACVNVVPVLIEGMGPGTVFSRSCPTMSIFTLSAVTCFIMEWLHMIWNIFGFLLFARRIFAVAPILILSHFAAAYFVCFVLHFALIPSPSPRFFLHVIVVAVFRL